MKMMPKIFIVDDDAEDLELIATTLEESKPGPNLKLFKSAKELLNYVNDPKNKDQNPQYIITDLVMPAMDGITMVKELRNHPAYKIVPIIMLSTSTLTDDIEKAYNAGVNCYLMKPDTFSGWKSTISTIKGWVERWYQAAYA